VPLRLLSAAAETSFVAYLHYLEDIAGVIGGLYGRGVAGVYQSMQLHPPLRALPPRAVPPQDLGRLAGHLAAAWTALSAIDNAIEPETFDRQANAVVPMLAVQALTSATRALAAALGTDEPQDTEQALAFLGDFVTEEILPYPWSAFCVGCPQTGSTLWGGSVLPGETVSVFQLPSAGTSDARLAMLLRTTRQRVLERAFAVERRTDVRPGRSRRNLTLDHKEAIAAATPPTTVFDVIERVRQRVDADDGEAFVQAPFDDEEALRFAAAAAAVADASMAAVESVVATVVGGEVFADLAASHRRRHATATAADRRAAAAAVLER
jgi:hypothetical protein